jgi:hypothetical protein
MRCTSKPSTARVITHDLWMRLPFMTDDEIAAASS